MALAQTQSIGTTGTTAGSGLRAAAQRHPLVAMYVLMFAVAWPVLIGQAIESYGLIPLRIPIVAGLLAGWAPAVAAFVVTALVGGRAGLRDLARHMMQWRVGIGWYVLAIFGLAVLMLAGAGLYVALSGTPVTLPASRIPLAQTLLAFVLVLGLGVLFNTEEIAWRGVALPHLQKRHNVLMACLLLAIPEALLHLPYFFTRGSFYQLVGPLAFLLFTAAEVILFAWVYNNTKGSLLVVTLLHASQNSWSNLVSVPDIPGPYYATVALLCAIAVALVTRSGMAHLSHQTVSDAPVNVNTINH